ncbi:carbohydrate ABC transporter substrate-binding protein [Vibrio sp. SCSIO 43140]|uniref:ABC transporter substrate-binding protein n=1 Tax=Vibrio sp. SCSIO 43140 TaxID=2819100 RepID=UPI0020759DF6|nr:ABC transporter substrate-binding protein [Vibrio sp. SCSIO 43140]USD62510.1 carbohydrate ABC transporter substrate-binding protein [Vibrio sp. SCSIO 43140]
MKKTTLSLCTGLAMSLTFGSALADNIVELEVASWKGSGTEIANFPTIIERFEKENPNIKVKLNFMARNDMVTSIPARFQAGSPPDVVMVDREFMTHWGENGQLMKLNEQPFINQFQPALQPYLGLGDDVYYSMLQVSGMGMYANDALLAKAGITDFPNTLEEFTETCRTLNEQGIIPTVLPGNNGDWGPYLFFISLALTDGDKPSQDRISKFNSGELKFSDDKYVKNAFESFRKMIDANCFNPKISAGTDPWSVALTTFQSGRIAMLPQGLWNITPFVNDELPEKFTLHPFPSANGNHGVVVDYIGPGWAIPNDATHKEAAMKWIDFWTVNENLKLFLEADTAISPLVNGDSGLPLNIASSYIEARESGHFVTYPDGSFPVSLTPDMRNDITAFMLNSDQDYAPILASWDAIMEKERAKK